MRHRSDLLQQAIIYRSILLTLDAGTKRFGVAPSRLDAVRAILVIIGRGSKRFGATPSLLEICQGIMGVAPGFGGVSGHHGSGTKPLRDLPGHHGSGTKPLRDLPGHHRSGTSV